MSKTYQERFLDFRLKSACGQVWLSLAADIASEADATIDRLTAERDAAREERDGLWVRLALMHGTMSDVRSAISRGHNSQAIDLADAAIAKDQP